MSIALSFVASLYGLALAAALLTWGARGGAKAGRAEIADPGAPSSNGAPRDAGWFGWLWRVLFAVLVGWPLLEARFAAAGSPFSASVSMLHWPAVLVVAGLAGALWLAGGPALRRRAPSAALAGVGTLAVMAGVVQTLVGFAGRDIATLSSGLSFVVTACFATLLGLALLAYPLEPRGSGNAQGGAALAARLAWLLFPLLTVGLLALVFVLILTPMPRAA